MAPGDSRWRMRAAQSEESPPLYTNSWKSQGLLKSHSIFSIRWSALEFKMEAIISCPVTNKTVLAWASMQRYAISDFQIISATYFTSSTRFCQPCPPSRCGSTNSVYQSHGKEPHSPSSPTSGWTPQTISWAPHPRRARHSCRVAIWPPQRRQLLSQWYS